MFFRRRLLLLLSFSSLFSVERISIVKIGIASRNVPRPRQMNLLKYTRNSTSVQYLHGPTGHGQDIYPETRDASRLNLATRLLSLLRGPCGLRFYCWKVFSVPLSSRFRPLYTLFVGKKRKGKEREGWERKKKMRRGGPRGNTERERERESCFSLRGGSGLIFRILFVGVVSF